MQSFAHLDGQSGVTHEDFLRPAHHALPIWLTRKTPFMLTSGQHPHTPDSMFSKAYLQGKLKNPAANIFADEMQQKVNSARLFLEGAQCRQKADADRNRKPQQFQVGTYVALSTMNLARRAKGATKLLPKIIGPFQVVEPIGEAAYRLLLPESMRIHDVFHVSLLKEWKSDTSVPPVSILMDKDDEQFEVEKILSHKGKGRSRRYLILWKGTGPEESTWESESSLKDCTATLQDY